MSSKLFRDCRDGTFEDVTEKTGLGGLDGVSVALFADYDNDGFKDLFVSRTFRPNQLFHNNDDGTFSDVTQESGIQEDCCTTVAACTDYDNDGYLDLYIGRYLDSPNGHPKHLLCAQWLTKSALSQCWRRNIHQRDGTSWCG